MCGIFGIWQYRSGDPPDADLLQESGRLMSHRGPDHQGGFSDGRIGLVHTRLSLLDLNSRANQPFWDPSGRHCIVYNGEIYNFRQLREQLEGQGVEFETTCDTEVLLHCLIEFGEDETLKKLEGMFTFVWYDAANRRLVLARDRFGMKPLFFHDGSDALVFASEIRALRPWLKFAPDPFSISAFLQGYSHPTQGFTHFQGIRILAPGTVMTVQGDHPPQTRRYFALTQFRDEDEAERLRRLPSHKLVDMVDEALSESVRMQLAADVPVGAFCSGGVDSSVVMAMATRSHSDLAIFHANVVGRHSEYEAAAKLARHLKLDLIAVDVNDRDFLEQLPSVTRHFGHAISYREDSIPMYMVCQLVARNGVRAAISGEGSDEIFGGYRTLMPRWSHAFNRLKPRPYMFRNLAKRLIQGRNGQLQSAGPKKNLGAGLLSRFEVDIENVERNSIGSSKDQVSLRMLTHHLRTLLHRNDSLGMSASIECRFPFLDTQLVRLGVNLPYRHKIRRSWRIRDFRHPFLQNKWILREVASRYMPSDLSLRPKRPFPTNAFERMRIPVEFITGSFAADLLELSSREIQFLVDHCHQDLLLRFLHLDVWANVCLDDQCPDEVVRRFDKHVTITPDHWTPTRA